MDITDQELFDAATSANPMQELAVEPAEPEQTAETARDEKGRFAPKAADEVASQPQEQPPVESQPAEQPAKQGFVPSSRLKEEADARRRESEEKLAERARADRLEQMLAQLVQQQVKPAPQPAAETPKPEVWDDPDQWVNNHIGTVKTEVQMTREFYSRKFAEQVHGADKVKEAYSALDTAISKGELSKEQVLAQLNQSMDPYGDIMGWYEKTAPQRDPESYKQKIIAEYLASQQQAGQTAQPAVAAQARPGPTISLPSLSKVGATSLPSRDGEESEEALWASVTRPKR